MDSSKKTMGRRKIPIQKIENEKKLQVAFSKRRMGLFKKASELCLLCGSDIMILVQSPANKVYAFGCPSVELVLRRFQSGHSSLPGFGESGIRVWENDMRNGYVEALKELEEKRRVEELWWEKAIGEMELEELWWDKAIEEMELEELEEYAAALEGLRMNVFRRLEEMERLRMTDTTALEIMTLTTSIYPSTPGNDRTANRRRLGEMERLGMAATTSHYPSTPANDRTANVGCSTSTNSELCGLDFDFGNLEWDLNGEFNQFLGSSVDGFDDYNVLA